MRGSSSRWTSPWPRPSGLTANGCGSWSAATRLVLKRNDALLREIILHLFVGDYDRAVELMANRHFRVAEGGENTVHDVYVDAHLLRGRKSLAAGDAARALKDFEAAMEYPARFEFARPHDGGREPEINWFLGAAHEALGNADEARRRFAAAVAKERRGTALAYWQGQAYRMLGREKEAREMFDDLVRTGERQIAKGGEADFFDKFGDRRSAATRKAQAHYLIGLGLLGMGKRARAKAEFRTALQCDINTLGAQTMLAGRSPRRCRSCAAQSERGLAEITFTMFVHSERIEKPAGTMTRDVAAVSGDPGSYVS